MKQFLLSLALLLALCLVCEPPARASESSVPALRAKSAVLMDAESGNVLFSVDPDARLGMASTTKIMTALTAIELYDPEDQITVRPEWCGIEGSSIYLKAGERINVRTLLYGLLLESGNDAAEALAGMHAEGKAGFIRRMNETASALGLQNTHFDNPSGLYEETHFTTARELALLAAHAMKDPTFAQIVGTKEIDLEGRRFRNHNKLLWEADACGVKTGFTKKAGRCLVSAKTMLGRTLICVTLNDPDDWEDHKRLYDSFYSACTLYEIVGAGDIGSVPLVSSEKQESRLYVSESFSMYLTPEERTSLRYRLKGPRFWYGAVSAGDRYGTLQVCLGDRPIWETPVFFGNTSGEAPSRRIWRLRINHK